jgi:hypothetical protein
MDLLDTREQAMARRQGQRVQIGVRVSATDRDYFAGRAQQAGLEPSVAVRQILELVNQRMRAGCDFIDALHELKTAWGVPHQSEIERRIAAAQKALGELQSTSTQAATLQAIETVERVTAGAKG